MSIDSAPARGSRATASLWVRMRAELGVFGLIAAGFVLLVAVSALMAPLISPYDPAVGSVLERHLPPSAAHLFGTDQAGRDIFSRVLWGARSSLLGPLIVVIITGIFGTALALTAAWWGGKVDALISRILDVLFAFPNLLLAIIVIAVFGPSMMTAALALAVAYVPYTARVIRSVALRERSMPYVKSAELQGISGLVVTVRHILPNVAPLIVTGATINFGYAMIELAALSFLGLGVQLPDADWGLMVSNGQSSLLQGHPEQSLISGLLIVLTVAAFGYVGEQLGGRKAGGRA